ncbi:MAG: hypothetical protein GXO31_00830 [Epsilonproteobacteria bacterium]|nr:hypothetical protein [Campylobacterota bacterium]
MKRVIIFITIFIFTGCGGGFYYTFKTYPFSKNSFSQIKEYIAFKEMEIPDYLKQNHIAVMENDKVKFLSAKWTEPVEAMLKRESIYFFMKDDSLGVLEYPWQKDIKAKAVIKLIIEDFIYKNGKVILRGYYILKKGDKSYKKLFSYEEKSNGEPDDIVNKMQRLYLKLLKDMKEKI